MWFHLDKLIKEKLKKVENILGNKKVLVAFSGGVDSSVMTRIAKEYCSKVLAVTVRSKTNPSGEVEEAECIAQELGVEWKSIELDELKDSNFRANPPNRCYFCKKGLMTELTELATNEGLDLIVDGTNADDLRDFRPGSLALKELNIKSPLAEAGITKNEIRFIAKQFNLSVHDKPSMACLASRIPYGEEITDKKLKMIAEAETITKELAQITVVRVRYHRGIARIEVHPNERAKFFDVKVLDQIGAALKKLGFVYITLDLQGYRSGSMNEPLTKHASDE
ncbi:MAG: ATP-dependent sacrificial sulfur transferase LarE [Candidatus Helarchaeota archaeon]|nr:ATP-dependent sacrificial sulfur transferase LarE [Candidatus Helarchaeota archaeon]